MRTPLASCILAATPVSQAAALIGHWLLIGLCLTAPTMAMAAGTDADWLSRVQKELSEREYHFRKGQASYRDRGGEVWQAPNRGQELRFYVDQDGLEVLDRHRGEVLARLTTVRWGRAGNMKKPNTAVRRVSANRLTLSHGAGLLEWYHNGQDGLEHGYSVAAKPEGEGPLVIELGTGSARAEDKGDAIALVSSGGQRLDYGELKVIDAAGAPVQADMTVSGAHRISLTVHDRKHHYPLTIDPLLTNTSDMTLEIDQADALVGSSVAGAGDVNGDGFADVIVGAPGFDGGQSNEGAAFVFHGGAGGVSTTVGAQLESNQADAGLGGSVAGAGDVNGDGFADVVVGAIFFDNGQVDEGVALVHHGGAGGVSTTIAATLQADQAAARMGQSVAGAGDVNGDGFADVIVGAVFFDNGENDEGAAFVFHGAAGGVSTTAGAVLQSNQPDARLGGSVAGAGDVNADGFADVIVGATGFDNGELGEGAAFVYLGGPSGVSTTINAHLEVNQPGASLGDSVAAAGDVNGDGFGDIIAGADSFDFGQINEGAAFVFHGGASGVSTTVSSQLESNQAGAQLGNSVAGAGDVNGDGYADVIVGAFLFANGEINEGAAFVFHGGSGGVSTTASAQLESNQIAAQLGGSVAGAGDVNGDGYADVIAGAEFFTNGESSEGAAFVYHGGAAGVSTVASAQLELEFFSFGFPSSIAGAGDVNGDGFADVILGFGGFDGGQINEGAAFVYHGSAAGVSTSPAVQLDESDQANALLGGSVAGAGDVNGDGFTDVIVGAVGFGNDQNNEGAAFVYHGSAAGVSANPSSQLESDQVNARLGWSVASAGDVNGDGFTDVIVGAPDFDNGEMDEGAAFVYHGGGDGVAKDPTVHLEPDIASARMGTSVAGAGDVNGDGFADVIAATSGINDAAFVYHGSAEGLSTTASTQLDNQAAFGLAVDGAGDVNGDGFADVIVGDEFEDAAFVYHGSAAGISTTVSALLESNQAFSSFGISVAGAGDVNGDGFADVIVGAPAFSNGQDNEGAAFVYHGSAAGVLTAASAQLESNQLGALLGGGVAGAGDVNGDGFADVIVRASLFDTGVGEGAAFVYHGSGDGRLAGPQALDGAGTALVQGWNLSFVNGAFQVRASLVSPRGRENVKLEIEACPPGVPFRDVSCMMQRSANWADTTVTGSVTLTDTVNGLMAGQLYHWRARALYAPLSVETGGTAAPPNPAAGPWRRLNADTRNSNIRVGNLATLSLTPMIASVVEEATALDFEIELSTSDGNPIWREARADLQTSDGTALVGVDYVELSVPVVFPVPTADGAVQLPPPLGILEDFVDEPDETVAVTLNGFAVGPSATVTILDDDTAAVLPTPASGLITSEAGVGGMFDVALNSEPTDDVVIGVASSDASEGTVDVTSLTFTPTDWDVPQTVTVTGQEDLIDDGDVPYSIVLGPITSNDAVYAALAPVNVGITNTDDDAAGVTAVPPSGLITSEGGASAVFNVSLTSEPTADVVIAVASSDSTEGMADVTSLTFTPLDWASTQSVTVTGANDAIDDGDQAYSIALGPITSVDGVYEAIDPDDVAVVNGDDGDTAGVDVTPTSGLITTESGGSDTFTVTLTSEPTADVAIAIASNDPGEGITDVAGVTFTAANWAAAQTVTVTGQSDAEVDGDQLYVIGMDMVTSADPVYASIDPTDVLVVNRDDGSQVPEEIFSNGFEGDTVVR